MANLKNKKDIQVSEDLKNKLGDMITKEHVFINKLQSKYDKTLMKYGIRLLKAKTKKEQMQVREDLKKANLKHAEQTVKGGIKIGNTWLKD